MKCFIFLAAIFTTFSLMGDIKTPIQKNEVGILERFIEELPAGEWELISDDSDDERMVKKWMRKEARCSEEYFIMLSSPWNKRLPQDANETFYSLVNRDKINVIAEKVISKDEFFVAFGGQEHEWFFVRLLTTPYGFYAACYNYWGHADVDPEYYFDLLTQYCYLVY